ncbi:MAG: ATP-binding cassette domain-containing protein, partial [Aestuariivirgaceae bacterium]
KHHVRELIKELSAARAIVISTHILEEVDAVCSRAIIIDKGRVVADGTADQLRKQVLGYLPEGAPAYGEMRVGSFLRFCADVRGLGSVEQERAIDLAMARTGLESVKDQVIDTLSKGFRRRVGLAQAILHEPRVLILDEPTDGLDPNQKHHVRELIKELSAARAIVISTHILEEVDAVCSRAIIIDKGRVVADGTADQLRKQVPGRKKSSMDDVFRHFTSSEEAAA